MGFASPFSVGQVGHRHSCCSSADSACRLDRRIPPCPQMLLLLLQDSTPAGPQALVIPRETWPHPSVVTGDLTPNLSDVSTPSPMKQRSPMSTLHPHSIYPLPPQPGSSNVVEIPVIPRERSLGAMTAALLLWPYPFPSSFLLFPCRHLCL